tara:strand:- start:25 stop:318 length:294 start_codon:yes stop_codon:yes gene_type:complete
MSKVEGYIEKAREDFIPILEKLRSILLKDEFQLEEGWKLSAPNDDHKGMVCWLAHYYSDNKLSNKGLISSEDGRGAFRSVTLPLASKTINLGMPLIA